MAETAAAAVSLAAVISFWRLFVHGSFLRPLALSAIAAHVVLVVCRRLGLGLATTALVAAGVGAVALAWILYPETTTYGVPTGTTLDVARTDLSTAWHQFHDVKAPAPVEPGFILASAIALWIGAYIADWAAFRLWVPFEAVVPASTLFVFASLLGADNHRGVASVVFVGAVLAFILLHRVARQQSSASWLAADVGRGSSALLRLGAWLLAGSLAAAAVVGPLLPGADAEPLVAWRDIGDGPSARSVATPLGEIRGQLGERSQVEMFQVQADRRDYWRLTSLDIFDGETWASRGSYSEADGRLPDQYGTDAPEITNRQRYDVVGLSAIWLPAAFDPRAIDAGDVDVQFEPETSTLTVRNDRDDSDGISYGVESAVPEPDAAALAAVDPAGIPGPVAERYLLLPDDFSPTVAGVAADVVAGAETPYEQAIALQRFFRDNFTYDLDVSLGFTPSDMQEFVLTTRAGFCQQFAGTYAAMARSVGLPARVAVGFTAGEVDPATPGLYHVRGEHAHAWPEVYISGYGWISFEPTPGRGRPGAEAYTGVPEQQAATGNPGSATTVPATATTAAPQTPASLDTIPPGEEASVFSGTADNDQGPSFWRTWLPRVAIAFAVVLAGALLYLVVVPLVHLWRRSSRRRRADGPDDEVRVAWQESVEAISMLGVVPRRSETPAEFANRTQRVIGPGWYEPLAAALETVDYSPAGADDETAEAAWSQSAGITTEVRRRTSRRHRVLSMLDPRPPDRRRPRRPHAPRPEAKPEGPTLELVE
jgi:transglutaminase-like putative cysteine protease